MKALVLVLALFVASCTGPLSGLLSPNASISNPVTRDMLYDVENSAIVVFSGLRAYKRSCVAQVIPQSCRDAIRKTQFYTRQIPPHLAQLRRFVRENDQINASVVYNTVQAPISNVRVEAAAGGAQ